MQNGKLTHKNSKMSVELELAAYTNNVDKFASIFATETFENEFLCDIYLKCIDLFCPDIILFLKDEVEMDPDELSESIVERMGISSLEINMFFFDYFGELLRPHIFDIFTRSLSTTDAVFLWYYEKFNTVIDIGIETSSSCVFFNAANYGNMRAIFWLFSMGFKPKNVEFYSLTPKRYRSIILLQWGKTEDEVSAEIIAHEYFSGSSIYSVDSLNLGKECLIKALLLISTDLGKNTKMLNDLIERLYALNPTRDEHDKLLKKIPGLSKYNSRFCLEVVPSAPLLTNSMSSAGSYDLDPRIPVAVAVPCNPM